MLNGFVAASSLIVVGVGIKNIILVSVNERTREIGLWKSIGATSRVLLIHFLIESSLLSLTEGLLGTAVGIGAAHLVSEWAGWIVAVTTPSIGIAFPFSAGVGVHFGYWPAKKASALSPIEARRYE